MSANDYGPITLDWTTTQQARASDPDASAWVSANAGSGKTHVLSQRVIRLLLSGARPSSVLCLTYTKAAASEMANRVFAKLAAWTRLSDAELAGELRALEGKPPAPQRLAFARQLFALALDTPGGLKIQTIHAFCEAVLHQFPLEANVAGHFSVMDDGETATLLAEARRTLLTATSFEDGADLAEAFAVVLDAAGEQGLETLLDELVGKRNELARFDAEAVRRGGTKAVLFREAGLAEGETESDIKAAVWPLPSMPEPLIRAYAAAAGAQSARTPQECAELLVKAGAAASAEDRWSLLSKLFLRADGGSKSTRNACAKDIAAAISDIKERFDAAAAHFAETLDRLATLRMLRATLAAHTLARRLNADYERLKRQRGRLDFDDLVERTADLLRRQGAGAWVHYKLDQGVDHILVDEAQDTSPPQWAIIRRLSEEFFGGENTRPAPRTLFSVGDEKQSIYSFQGARPERFREEGRSAEKRAADVDLRFENVELKLSFRSTADVLKAVDHVFENPDSRRGLGADGAAVVHESVRGREPGLVDLWEMIGRDKRFDSEDWTAPFDETPESDPKVQLAKRVAATIREWIAFEHRVGKGKRLPIRAGDILVLVRKRDGFVNALMRELKHAPTISVAGADRLTLIDHIAVKDLMALGRAVSLPDDDLSLAALLKSPLFEFTEDDVYRLCHERPERASVAAHLRSLAAAGKAPFAAAQAKLDRCVQSARQMPVHDFYAHVLGPGGGRAAFVSRLGSEAADILDEFLAFALEHEASGLPGLQSFLAVLEEQSPVVKRELEQGRDEVRIMTVHASKGLEAPVVFLVDSGGEAARGQHIPKLRSLDVGGFATSAVLWIPSKDFESSLSRALKDALTEAAEEEYRRLLYVGMTRAADRLVVCGYHGIHPPRGPHWLAMVRDALLAKGACPREFAAGGLTWPGLRFRINGHTEAFPQADEPEQGADVSRTPLPLSPLPPPTRPPRPLAPSGAASVLDDDAPAAATGSPFFPERMGDAIALERGRVTHRLLQVLPNLAAQEREPAALRYLARAVPAWQPDVREAIVGSVLSILNDAAFGAVFAEGGEAEVSVMGTIRIGEREHVVSGRIDRLAVSDNRVLIIDYKTNRAPRSNYDEPPFAYRAQMALYRELLAPLYRGRRIEAALIFTGAPMLIPLSHALLDATLAEIGAK